MCGLHQPFQEEMFTSNTVHRETDSTINWAIWGFNLLNPWQFLGFFIFFFILAHFHSLLAHFSQQYKVLYLYRDSTIMGRSGENFCAVWKDFLMIYFTHKKRNQHVQHSSQCPQVFPKLEVNGDSCLLWVIYHKHFTLCPYLSSIFSM